MAYTVRRIPTGPGAVLADADIRTAASCTYDFGHRSAAAVVSDLDAILQELSLPR